MAVVKSPKNTKRKNLWVKSLVKKIKSRTTNQLHLASHTRVNTNCYSNLYYRKRKKLLMRNLVFLL
jgi:hypothetical protein